MHWTLYKQIYFPTLTYLISFHYLVSDELHGQTPIIIPTKDTIGVIANGESAKGWRELNIAGKSIIRGVVRVRQRKSVADVKLSEMEEKYIGIMHIQGKGQDWILQFWY